jgi:hypothetical protein
MGAVSAEAGYLNRKGTIMVEGEVGYQMPQDEQLKKYYDGGKMATAKVGYCFTGNLAALGKFSYRTYHRKPEYGAEPGGGLNNYQFGAGLKYNVTQGNLIIPYFAVFGNYARYSYAGPSGDLVSNVPQAEGFFGIEFFLRPQFIADASIGYYKSFGEVELETTGKMPLGGPVEPEGILLNFGFAVFL